MILILCQPYNQKEDLHAAFFMDGFDGYGHAALCSRGLSGFPGIRVFPADQDEGAYLLLRGHSHEDQVDPQRC